LKHKLRISRSEALAQITKAVSYGCTHCDDVEFSAEDASRTDLDFLFQAIEAAAAAGANIINLPDTVGYTTPDEYGDMFRAARKRLAAYPKIIFSAHCHNDLGLAVANSLAAIAAGARQVECTINGIGERAGNASLEEIAVALQVRKSHFAVRTNITLEKIYATSRMLSAITSINVPPNKAVVGANAFAHEAGIHQDGILKNPLTYEIILPEKVGVPARRLVLGKHSGRLARAVGRAGLYDQRCRTGGVLRDGDGAGRRGQTGHGSRPAFDHSQGAPGAHAGAGATNRSRGSDALNSFHWYGFQRYGRLQSCLE
jgi:2-isopropylmalate synthase